MQQFFLQMGLYMCYLDYYELIRKFNKTYNAMTINYTTPAPLDARLRAAFRARYNWTGADKDLDAFILQCHKDFTKSVLQSAETDEAQRAAVATKRAEIEGLF